jgi:hypothetical protein
MERSRFIRLAGLLAVLATASLAATANASAGASPTGSAAVGLAGSPAIVAGEKAGSVQISYALKQFVTRNGKLHARGEVIARVETAEGTRVARKPFQALVRGKSATRTFASAQQQQQQTCQVLALIVGPIYLNLLGLIVETNQINILVTADPAGGILGQLLCGLAGGPAGVTATQAKAAALTRALRSSRLSTGALATAPQPIVAQQLPPVPEGHCTILDLRIAPIYLNLLGLIVQTSEIHLRITADPNGGLLGQLLCGLLGPPPTPV